MVGDDRRPYGSRILTDHGDKFVHALVLGEPEPQPDPGIQTLGQGEAEMAVDQWAYPGAEVLLLGPAQFDEVRQ